MIAAPAPGGRRRSTSSAFMAGTAPLEETHQAVSDALWAVLRPLARLAIARGVPCGTAEELLRRAFVDAAREAQPEPSAARIVSRISTATGLTRRQVTQLLEQEPQPAARQRSLATEVFAHWTTSRAFRDRRGAPRVLPRQGEGRTSRRSPSPSRATCTRAACWTSSCASAWPRTTSSTTPSP